MSSIAKSVVEAKQLTKIFGQRTAVNQLSFQVPEGSVYGFLGQNGAGKSTTMRMMLSLIQPTSGNIHLFGHSVSEHRQAALQQVGAVIEKPDLYKYLNGWDNLHYFSRLSGHAVSRKRLEEVIELVGLKGREKDKVGTYSQGMKQRLGIGIALAHHPKLLLLDEPTNGLDPQGIADIRRLINYLSKEEKKTIIVSSHLLYEVEQMATHMIIIHEGKKLAEGAMKDLFDPKNMVVSVSVSDELSQAQSAIATTWLQDHLTIHAQDRQLHFRISKDQLPQLHKTLVTAGLSVMEVQARHQLEDYFLQLTNASHVSATSLA